MPLSQKAVQQLFKAGFIQEEILEFNKGVMPNGEPMPLAKIVKSEPWKAMLKARANWWKMALRPANRGGLGLTVIGARQVIKNYYKPKWGSKDRSPWEFLRVEYRPPNKMTATKIARAAISKRRITRQFKRYSIPRRKRVIKY